MMFVNAPGATNFRALRVESGDQHLYWQPTYQHILRVEGAFGEFFPQAEFSDNGNQVIFTKYVDRAEVLSQTRALRPGERIPRGEWQRFLQTWHNFKRLADRPDIPEDVRNFICKFGPPSVERYPAAYRIYQPHWYSKSRLFVLWGLEPVGGADFVAVSPEEAISEGSARAETDGEEAGSNLARWLKIFLFGLLAVASLLFLLWCCLPRPVVDFELSAVAKEPATTKNLTVLDRSLDWGATDYLWSFTRALPGTSAEYEPKPVWLLPGSYEVALQATQTTLWGFLYKTETKTMTVTVTELPKPPVVIQTIPGLPVPVVPPEAIPAPKREPAEKADSSSQVGEVFPDGKNVPNVPKARKPKPDGVGKEAERTGPDSNGDKPNREGNMVPREPRSTDSKGESHDSVNPNQAGPDGKKDLESKMRPPAPDSAGPNATGGDVPDRVSPGEDGKMIPGAPKPSEARSSGEVPPKPSPDKKGGGKGKAYPDSSKNTSPQPAVPTSQILPVPQVVIDNVTILSDGKSQDIDFSLSLPKGVTLEHLEVDGAEVVVQPNGAFRLRLPVGPHSLHIEYGSASADLHGQVTQELMVDADQVKIIKPKTRIAPPVKVPGSDQAVPPVPPKAQDTAAEKFDKKTA